MPKNKKRKVTHKNITTKLCEGPKRLTVGDAKQLLGWEEEKQEAPFGSDYLLNDFAGVHIRCTNNMSNRPLSITKAHELKQEILRNRWRMNGETIIIGNTGLLLNGQHRLVALIFAAQERDSDPEKWESNWSDEPTIDVLIVFGIEESDEVVNTMDTCRPRTLSDVIYRSQYFPDLNKSDQKSIARTAQYAVSTMWRRTGAGLDEFALRQTHSESLDFIGRHPKLLKCIKTVHDLNDGRTNKIGRYVGAGYAAALLYLMSCCGSDPDKYYEADSPAESDLEFTHQKQAVDFFKMLASGDKKVEGVRKALARILDDEGGSIDERCGLLVKAWNCLIDGDNITPARISLEYFTDDDGFRTLVEFPTVGGIDLADPTENGGGKNPDPTPEEVHAEAAKIRQENAAKKCDLSIGDRVVTDTTHDDLSFGDNWGGEVIDLFEVDNEVFCRVVGQEETIEIPVSLCEKA